MRRKEYAVSLGLATAGRGRLSREALDAIEKARSEGVVFDDDGPGPVVTAKPAKTRSKPTTATVSTGMIGEAKFFYPLSTQFQGVDSSGKKVTVSGRNICRRSGYSMVGCGCGDRHETLAPNMEIITVSAKD